MTGDALFGSTVTDLQFYSTGLNNRGQVAFRAALADGTLGIYRADPWQAVPEPSTLAVAFSAVICMICAARLAPQSDCHELAPLTGG